MSFQAIATVSKWHNVARNYVKMTKTEQKNPHLCTLLSFKVCYTREMNHITTFYNRLISAELCVKVSDLTFII